MNVLSLFDGMSCGQIALNRIGIVPGKYYAAEIDKYAIKVTQANHPGTIQLGDIGYWRSWDINWSSLDLVTGGFPCQAWSMAGKQLGDKDERGMLFWVMLDIMKNAKQANPKIKFLIENVKMKKEFEDYITHHTEQALGEVNKVLINSALVSAQNRRRFYWTNWHVEQPEDKRIVLTDVIEQSPGEITVMSDKFTKRNAHILRDDLSGKAKNLSAMEYVKNGRQGDYIKCLSEKEMAYMMRSESVTEYKPRILRSKELHEKSNTITQSIHKGVPHGVIKINSTKILCGAIRGRYIVNGKRADNELKIMAAIIEQRLEVIKDEKTNTLTTVQKDNVVIRNKSKTVRSGGRGSYDRHEWDSISNCHYRKLTPTECERLQTVPDGYTNHVSNTQRYKMLGNGWTVDVIAHILSQADL
jgi:DNA-cytosine methyltransferase